MAKMSNSWLPLGNKNKAHPSADVLSLHVEPLPKTEWPTSTGKQSRRRRKSLVGSLVRIGLLTTLAVGAIGGYFTYQWLQELGVFHINDADFDIITPHKPSDNTLVYDRDGEKIGEFFTSYHVYREYKDLPKFLVKAIVAVEDRNFWKHQGYDPKGMLRAAWVHLKGQRYSQGASTITQQLVRNFMLTREKTINRKVKEIAHAAHLEKLISKQKIIELYSNSLFLGHGSYGVGAAAFRYFGKDLKDIRHHEAALIAGLFQSPSNYNPHKNPKLAKKRQLQVLRSMLDAGYISKKYYRKLVKRKLRYKEYEPLNSQVAPYFIDYVRIKAEEILIKKGKTIKNKGLRIYTTLDSKLQKSAEESLATHEPMIKDLQSKAAFVHKRRRGKDNRRANVEASMLSVDPRNGEILTMVGGRDYKESQYNRTWSAKRSPGSSFKPIVFTVALEEKNKWSDMIFVSPVTVNNYRPHTPSDDFLTETTLLRAFYRSMNTPTVELGQKLGLGPVLKRAKELGIDSELKQEFGTMLGSSDVTMMDMARVYSTYANGGFRIDPVAITKIEDRDGNVLHELMPAKGRKQRVMSPQISYMMTQGMRDVLRRGTGYESASLSRYAAGKTGTSNGAMDNWFCGFTPNHVAIVWVGTDEHKPIYGNITGGKVALPIWDTYMRASYDIRKPSYFPRPAGVVATRVHPKYGHRSQDGIPMWFLRGQLPPAEPSPLEALSQKPGQSYRDVFMH